VEYFTPLIPSTVLASSFLLVLAPALALVSAAAYGSA
jgi:hypothetical protein